NHRREVALAARPRALKRAAGCLRARAGEKIMNDQELDDMLNQWDTPAVPPTMRENVRAGFRERVVRAIPIIPRPRFPRLRFVFGFAGLAAALLLATAAFPQVAL